MSRVDWTHPRRRAGESRRLADELLTAAKNLLTTTLQRPNTPPALHVLCFVYFTLHVILFACKSSCACQLIIINEDDDDDDDDDCDPGQLSQPWTLPMSLSLTSYTVKCRCEHGVASTYPWNCRTATTISERTRLQRRRSAEANEQTAARLSARRISTTL